MRIPRSRSRIMKIASVFLREGVTAALHVPPRPRDIIRYDENELNVEKIDVRRTFLSRIYERQSLHDRTGVKALHDDSARYDYDGDYQ